MKITRGALVLAVLQIVVTLVWLVLTEPNKAVFSHWLVVTPRNMFEHGHVWALVTSPFLEVNFVSLILSLLMLWMFVPTLERFWGTTRFLRFVAVTSIIGGLAGAGMGMLTGRLDEAVVGLSPFVYASIVAFGILYARQPVEFSFYIRMTGRQLMWGFIAFLVLFIGLQQLWELGASYAAAMITAAVMTSKRWSPGLMWKRWRIARARAKLSVIEGGALAARTAKKKRPTDEQRFIN